MFVVSPQVCHCHHAHCHAHCHSLPMPDDRKKSPPRPPAPPPPASRGSYPALDLLVVLVLVFIWLPTLDPDMSAFTTKEELQLSFLADWHDPTSQVNRRFNLNYFPKDNSVEMYDLKNKKIFLSRIKCETVDPKDFYLGNAVVVLSRRLVITEYANEQTRLALESSRESTFAMIKPDGLSSAGAIVSAAEREGFALGRAVMTRLTRTQAEDFYAEHRERSFFEELVDYMISGPVLAMVLRRSNAVAGWRELLGPTDPAKARLDFPKSIRAQFGTDKTENAAHGSDSREAAEREVSFFFGPSAHGPRASANVRDSTCCVVKPHLVRAGKTGEVIADIQNAGFNISGLQSFNLRYEHAEEFFEIYKGVVHDYNGMVKQLSSGPSVVLEVSHPDSNPESSGSGDDVVTRFRELVGPSDPELARTLRPGSLRARYGISREENGIHCTDLPEDGPLEVEYFFRVLQQPQ